MEDKWVLVALYPDGRVCSAAVINYCEEAEFRKENEGMHICFVPGPVILGAPLSDQQQAVSVDDLSIALNELAALRAQAEAVAGLRAAVVERDTAWQALIVAEREWCVIPGASSMTDEEFDAADDASHAKYLPATRRHQAALKALEGQLAALAQADAGARS